MEGANRLSKKNADENLEEHDKRISNKKIKRFLL